MCKRCAAVREAMSEAAADTSLAGARNIVVPLATEGMVLFARSLQHVLPESMVDAERPYQAVADLVKIMQAGLDFEINTPLDVLPHEPQGGEVAKFSDTPVDPVVDGEIVDATYQDIMQRPPAPKPDQDLIDLGGDILKDMMGEGGTDVPPAP